MVQKKKNDYKVATKKTKTSYIKSYSVTKKWNLK